MAPVGMAAIRSRGESAPIRMMEPLPQLLLDLGDGQVQRLAAVGVEPGLVSGHSTLYLMWSVLIHFIATNNLKPNISRSNSQFVTDFESLT